MPSQGHRERINLGASGDFGVYGVPGRAEILTERVLRYCSGLLCCLGLAVLTVALIAMTPPVPAKRDPTTLPVSSKLASRLKHHVEYLASPDLKGRQPGTAGNRAAAEYIKERFREAGLTPLPSLGGFGQPVTPELGDNIIGVREATTSLASSPWLLLGAHYDHLGGNFLGADDNAAAVAILLETADALPSLAHHHVVFVTFNTEEPPYIRTPLMGSQHFVDHLPPEIGAPGRIQAALIMDLMGGVHWEPLRDVIFAAGAEKAPNLYRRVKDAIAQFQPEGECGPPPARARDGEPLSWTPAPSSTPSPCHLSVLPVGMHVIEEIPLVGQVSFSDYDAFRNAGVPFLFLSAGRTPRYHQTSDLPDTLHYERMAVTVRWLQQLLGVVDQDTRPYEFVPDGLEFADEVASFRPLVAKAAQWNSRIPNTSMLSFWKVQHDDEWLRQLDPSVTSADAIKRLERISLRMQCLVADFPACFLL